MMKLLLVDDDAFLRDMYATKFTECGHEVDSADSGLVALGKVQQQQDFDIVLLDMVMPGMSGVELIQAFKQRFPDLETKYVVLSNQGQNEDIKEAIDAGASGYIVKAELIPSDVVRKVEALVKSKK